MFNARHSADFGMPFRAPLRSSHLAFLLDPVHSADPSRADRDDHLGGTQATTRLCSGGRGPAGRQRSDPIYSPDGQCSPRSHRAMPVWKPDSRDGAREPRVREERDVRAVLPGSILPAERCSELVATPPRCKDQGGRAWR